ncbi:MAG: O-antigen ligase family protein [Bacillota bacterium]
MNLLRWLMWGLGASALVTSLIGLLVPLGLLHLPVGDAQGLRVASLLQYPDALAAFAMVGLLSIGAASLEMGGSLSFAIGAGAAQVVFVAFFLAASRGAFLVLPVVVCLALWLTPRRKAVDLFALFLISGFGALLILRGFSANLAINDAVHALKWLIFGAATTATGALGWSLLALRLGRLRRDRVLLAAAIVGAVAIGLGLAFFTLHFTVGAEAAGTQPNSISANPSRFISALLPGFIADRTASMTLETSSAAQRLTYYADTLRALLTHPLGFGAGAWPSVFGQVQRFYYVGRNVHSQLLQMAVDAGIIGLALYGAFWVGLAMVIWRLRSVLRGNDRLVLAGTASGAVALGLHGTIDFTLSFFALYLIIWIVAGALVAVPVESVAKAQGWMPAPKVPRWMPATIAIETRVIRWLALAALVVAPFMFVSATAAWRGLDHLETGHMPEAQADYTIAARFEPWSAPAHLGLARAMLVRSQGSDAPPGMAREALRQARLAVRFDRALSGGYGTLAQALLNLPDGPSVAEAREAVGAAEKAVAYQKYRPVYYPTLGETYVTLALKTDDDAEREDILARLTDLPDVVAQRQGEIEPYKRLFVFPQVSMVPELALRVGQGYLLAGDLPSAEDYLLQAAQDRALTIPAEVWLHRLHQLSGDKGRLEALKSKPWILFADQNPEFQRLRELTAEFEKKGGK